MCYSSDFASTICNLATFPVSQSRTIAKAPATRIPSYSRWARKSDDACFLARSIASSTIIHHFTSTYRNSPDAVLTNKSGPARSLPVLNESSLNGWSAMRVIPSWGRSCSLTSCSAMSPFSFLRLSRPTLDPDVAYPPGAVQTARFVHTSELAEVVLLDAWIDVHGASFGSFE